MTNVLISWVISDTVVKKLKKVYPSKDCGPLRICGRNHFVKNRLTECNDATRFDGKESDFLTGGV